MSTFKKTLIILFVTMGLASCDVLTQVAQMANFANCKFNFNSVDQIQMLGVNLSKGMSKSDLNATQLLSLANALANRKLPVTFNVNVGVNNPNSIPASMTKMDYIVSLNGKEVISTSLNKSISVGATQAVWSPFPSPPTCSNCSVANRLMPYSTWPSSWPVPVAIPSTWA